MSLTALHVLKRKGRFDNVLSIPSLRMVHAYSFTLKPNRLSRSPNPISARHLRIHLPTAFQQPSFCRTQKQLFSSSPLKKGTSIEHLNEESTPTTATTNKSTETTKIFLEELKGVSKSHHISSKQYITHFIANENHTFTMESAIESVLTRSIPFYRRHRKNDSLSDMHNISVFALDETMNYFISDDHDGKMKMEEWGKLLVDYEMKNPIVQSIEAKFRFDPVYLGDHYNHEHGISVDTSDIPKAHTDQLSPAELVALGSVWYLPHDAPRDPSLGGKPIRVELKDFHQILVKGDYLRVHHSPKRFPNVNQYDWGKSIRRNEGQKNDDEYGLPGVIVEEDPDVGYVVINKPPGVPVHPTVDNVLENVAGAIGRSLVQKNKDSLLEKYHDRTTAQAATNCGKFNPKQDPLVYVATPQRLDQNTSGLFVAATKKSFAAYFAKLLRKKTDKELKNQDTKIPNSNKIQKKYRCLVCISCGGMNSSMQDEYDRLDGFVRNETIIRHYLEPALKTPRTFAEEVPDHSDWLECLLRLEKVGSVYPLLGSETSSQLCNRLWGNIDLKPKDCVAVAEVEVELLTGRTHQIRGQLATIGYPLCGDELYGGAINPSSMHQSKNRKSHGYKASEYLCLQCCELSFLSQLQEKKMNTFRLEEAWWSAWLSEYDDSPKIEATTSSSDNSAEVKEISQSTLNVQGSTDDDISQVPLCQLSPGQNKYVIIKASKFNTTTPLWFVRSASPKECGGPYHADVAKEIMLKLSQIGYETQVVGGGRINYDEENKEALVYGFSYGFGKGDHEFVSLLIEKHDSSINASFDNSDLLY